jgi:hypothetical protein
MQPRGSSESVESGKDKSALCHHKNAGRGKRGEKSLSVTTSQSRHLQCWALCVGVSALALPVYLAFNLLFSDSSTTIVANAVPDRQLHIELGEPTMGTILAPSRQATPTSQTPPKEWSLYPDSGGSVAKTRSTSVGVLLHVQENYGTSTTARPTAGSVGAPVGNMPIPQILHMTYNKNLLLPSSSAASDFSDHDHLLRQNVENTALVFGPEFAVLFHGNNECEHLLRATNYSALIPYFRAETKGMYKGDICRGAALLSSNGGFYIDIDVRLLTPFHLNLVDVDFVTLRLRSKPEYFQAVMGVSAEGLPIISKYMDMLLEYYMHKWKPSGHLGTSALYVAHRQFPSTRSKLFDETLLSRVNGTGVPKQEGSWGDEIAPPHCNRVIYDATKGVVVAFSGSLEQQKGAYFSRNAKTKVWAP